MSFDREFYVLKDGQAHPTDQSCAETDLSVFCKEQIEAHGQRVIDLLENLKKRAEQTSAHINACQKGFFLKKNEKEEAYALLCDFFLALEASKISLMDEAVGLEGIAERLFEALWLAGEENTERTDAARKAAMLCDGLMQLCTDTLERLCDAIAETADFEHECFGVRLADTARLCVSISENIGNLQKTIKGD